MTSAIPGDHECFSEDWRRTDPDLVLYLPKEPSYWIEAVDHVLVDVTPGGDLLAIFALASQPHGADYRVAYSRSADGGRTWSPVGVIDGPGDKPGQVSAFGFPIISRQGRIYCYYNHGRAIGDSYQTSFLRCKYSDDDGRTWIDGEVVIPYRSSANDHPDRSIGANCVVWQKPIRDARDRPIIGFTRWTNSYVKTARREDDFTMSRRDSQAEFMRFENIDESPHPRDVQITWLQDDDTAIRVPVPYEPEASRNYSYCEEPSAVLLPDGRLFTVARTATGQIWYTISTDDGVTWRPTEPLRNRDDGSPMLNPVSPCPIFALDDGRFLLMLQNHDGHGYGGRGPRDFHARRPQFVAVGEYRPNAHQPIWFSQPQLLFDTQNIGVFPFYMKWLSMYASLTEHQGERILWYADRKIFGLGRYITDDLLAPMEAPPA